MNEKFKKLKRQELKQLMTACLGHAFLIYERAYQEGCNSIKSKQILQIIRRFLGKLWYSCSIM